MTLDQYNNRINTYIQSPDFAALTNDEQQESLKQLRQQYLDQNPDSDVDSVNVITESNNKLYLRSTGKGRAIPNVALEDLGFNLQGYDDLSKEEKNQTIEEFRSKIPELSKNNPTQREDTEFYLNQMATEMERRSNGEGRSWVGDKFSRAGEGLFAGLLNYVGADDMAQNVRRYFHENPEMDEDFSSMLASGIGDLGASMTIFLGTALTTKGLGGSATAATRTATGASLASNGIMRYNEAYNKAIEKGLDDAIASEAGVAALPAAVIDVLGDRIIGSNLFPDNVNKIFKTGSSFDKQKALSSLIKDSTAKAKLFEVGRTALGEGLTEVAGDYMAGYGPYLTTGIDDYLPTDQEMRDSFLVGAVLGGTIGTASNAGQFLGNKSAPIRTNTEGNPETPRYSTVDQMRLSETEYNLTKINSANHQQVFDLLSEGQYKSALDLTNQLMKEQELITQEKKQDQQQTVVEPTEPQGQLLLGDSPEIQTIDQRKQEFFGSLPNINNRVYDQLTDTIFQSSSLLDGVEVDQAKIDSANEIINAAAPNRSLLHQSINQLSQPNQEVDTDAEGNVIEQQTILNPNQGIGVKNLIDTVAAQWLSKNPDRDINQFYGRININQDYQGFFDLSQNLLTQPSQGPQGTEEIITGTSDDNSITLGPNANIDTTLSGMMTVLRSSGIMEETLTPEEFQQVRDSIGVEQDFTQENDIELANRFKQWLGSQEGELGSVFSKMKQWVQDIYKSFRSLISPQNRNKDLDQVFESLFQVTLSPQEFRTKTEKQKQVQADPTPIQDQDSDTLLEASRRFEDTKREMEQTLGPVITPSLIVSNLSTDPVSYSQFINQLKEDNSELFDTLDQMSQDIQSKNPGLKINYDPMFNADGAYDPNTNQITIGVPNMVAVSHEVAHALTYSDISRYVDSKEGSYQEKLSKAVSDESTPIYIKELIGAYRHAANALGYNPQGYMDLNYINENNISLDEYQFSTLDEFVAATMSSQSFQERLANIPYQGQTVWERIVNLIGQAYQWMSNVANPELLMRSNGENVLTASLMNIQQVIQSQNSNERIIKTIDAEYLYSQLGLDITNPYSEGVDINQFSRIVTNEVSQSLSNGEEVIYIPEPNKEVKITSIVRGMMSDSQNQRWGVTLLATPSTDASRPRIEFRKKNILFSPQQTRAKKLGNAFKRLSQIRKGNLNDKYDSQTKELTQLIGTIRPSDIHLLGNLDPKLQDEVFRIIDNIYESRKNAMTNPQNRIPTDQLLIQARRLKDMADSFAISDMIADYDDVINWGDIDIDDRVAVEQAINDYLKQDNLLDEARKSNRSAKRKEALNKKYAKYRQKYKDLKQQSITRFGDADNYVSELEAIWGGSLEGNQVLRDFMKEHYNYLTSVDVDSMEGVQLYRHHYALNNLFDGNGGYFELTIQNLASRRNAESKVSTLQGTFRDPMVERNKFLMAWDSLNQKGEIAQTQFNRLSAYENTRNFIQEDLLGVLTDQVIRVSENRSVSIKEQMAQSIESFEKVTGRVFGWEDRAVTAIASRLMQYELGGNPDTSLKRNITKERQSIENLIRRGDRSNRVLFQTKILPLFEKMVEGLEGMDNNAMQEFMNTLDGRMRGSYDIQTSKERQKILEVYQNAFSQFDLESRLISEGFYKTPFKQMAYYVTNNVSTFNSNPSGVNAELHDNVDNWEDLEFKSGLKSKESHFHERQERLRRDQFYSYNIEGMTDRNISRMVVGNTTVVERHVISERLKRNSELNQIISDGPDENFGRINAIKEQAKTIVNNSFSRGEPGNFFSDTMRTAVNMYARVALSSMHHIVTQPLTAVTDYGIRTGNFKGWFDALRFYTQNLEQVDEWFNRHQSWTGRRGALDSYSLDTRSIREEDKIKSSKAFKRLDSIYEGASDLITISIRNGDRFSAKATVLAEYVRLMQEKGYQIHSLDQILEGPVEGNILTQATLNAERNINTSGKVLRGELFSDRRVNMTIVRNLLFAFSSHSANLSTQGFMAVRDLIELKGMNASREEILPKIKTLAAISAQTAMFSMGSWAIGSMMTKAMIQMIQSMFDDEEGKIEELELKVSIAQENGDKLKIAEARQELAMAKSVRTVVEKMDYNSGSFLSLFQRTLRDQLGTTAMVFSNSDALRINPLVWIGDKFGEHIYKESSQEIIKDYEQQIREAKDAGDVRTAARLSEELITLRAQEFIPIAYKDYSSMETGGIYGAAISAYDKGLNNILKGLMGASEFGFNDIAIAGTIIGLGQADINKLFNAFDKIENEQYENLNRYQDEILPRAQLEQEEAEDRRNQQLLRQLLRN